MLENGCDVRIVISDQMLEQSLPQIQHSPDRRRFKQSCVVSKSGQPTLRHLNDRQFEIVVRALERPVERFKRKLTIGFRRKRYVLQTNHDLKQWAVGRVSLWRDRFHKHFKRNILVSIRTESSFPDPPQDLTEVRIAI